MITPAVDVRVRRPQAHEALVQELQKEAGFPAYRDVLLFAASLGEQVKRRVPFTATGGDPIRYDTLTNTTHAEALIRVIAANELPDDPEILDQARLAERVQIFEEYANGGLEYIQEQANTRHQPADLVVVALVTESLSQSGGAEAAAVEDLLGGVSWT